MRVKSTRVSEYDGSSFWSSQLMALSFRMVASTKFYPLASFPVTFPKARLIRQQQCLSINRLSVSRISISASVSSRSIRDASTQMAPNKTHPILNRDPFGISCCSPPRCGGSRKQIPPFERAEKTRKSRSDFGPKRPDPRSSSFRTDVRRVLTIPRDNPYLSVGTFKKILVHIQNPN